MGRGIQVQTDQWTQALLCHRQSRNQTGYLSYSYWYWQGFRSRENKRTELVRVTQSCLFLFVLLQGKQALNLTRWVLVTNLLFFTYHFRLFVNRDLSGPSLRPRNWFPLIWFQSLTFLFGTDFWAFMELCSQFTWEQNFENPTVIHWRSTYCRAASPHWWGRTDKSLAFQEFIIQCEGLMIVTEFGGKELQAGKLTLLLVKHLKYFTNYVYWSPHSSSLAKKSSIYIRVWLTVHWDKNWCYFSPASCRLL